MQIQVLWLIAMGLIFIFFQYVRIKKIDDLTLYRMTMPVCIVLCILLIILSM